MRMMSHILSLFHIIPLSVGNFLSGRSCGTLFPITIYEKLPKNLENTDCVFVRDSSSFREYLLQGSKWTDWTEWTCSFEGNPFQKRSRECFQPTTNRKMDSRHCESISGLHDQGNLQNVN